jgi:DNA gyrase/topoisomerase IV subunit A
LQDQENIESKIKEYEHILTSAAALYHQIKQSVTSQSNDYNLDVMTRLTTATFNFKNTIEQTDAA